MDLKTRIHMLTKKPERLMEGILKVAKIQYPHWAEEHEIAISDKVVAVIDSNFEDYSIFVKDDGDARIVLHAKYSGYDCLKMKERFIVDEYHRSEWVPEVFCFIRQFLKEHSRQVKAQRKKDREHKFSPYSPY